MDRVERCWLIEPPAIRARGMPLDNHLGTAAKRWQAAAAVASIGGNLLYQIELPAGASDPTSPSVNWCRPLVIDSVGRSVVDRLLVPLIALIPRPSVLRVAAPDVDIAGLASSNQSASALPSFIPDIDTGACAWREYNATFGDTAFVLIYAADLMAYRIGSLAATAWYCFHKHPRPWHDTPPIAIPFPHKTSSRHHQLHGVRRLRL